MLKWVQRVEGEGTRHEEFEESGSGFETLDRKLAAALIRVTKGELSRRINLESQKANSRGKVLKGRQVYWMILNTFKTNPNMGVVYGVRDISKVQWLGDDKLETLFTVINQLRNPMAEAQLAEVLLELLDQSKEMKDDIGHYRRMLSSNPHKAFDYQYLLDCMDRQLALKLYKTNQNNLTKAIEGAGRPSAAATSGKPKAACKYFAEGTCKHGKDCSFSHAQTSTAPPQHGKGKSPAPRTARSSSPSGDKKATACFKHQLGLCPHSAKACSYSHRKLTDDEKVSFEKFKDKMSGNTPVPPAAAAFKAPCPEWKKGLCAHGDDCSFYHGPKAKQRGGREKAKS